MNIDEVKQVRARVIYGEGYKIENISVYMG